MGKEGKVGDWNYCGDLRSEAHAIEREPVSKDAKDPEQNGNDELHERKTVSRQEREIEFLVNVTLFLELFPIIDFHLLE